MIEIKISDGIGCLRSFEYKFIEYFFNIYLPLITLHTTKGSYHLVLNSS